MASSPVTAPAPKPSSSSTPPSPPHDSSPPPKTSPPPTPQDNSSPPPDEAATKSPPPDEAKSPPPNEVESPPAPPPPDEAKSPPPPTPTPPAATLTPSPPPIITPPPSSPPPLLPTSSPPPPQTLQNPVLLSPPIPSNNPINTPSSSVNVFPPPQLPISTPLSSSGTFFPPPNAPTTTHRTPSPHTPSSSNDGSSSSSHNDLISDKLPLVVGFTAGVGLLFIAMIVIVVVCSKKKKKGTPMNNQLQYYGNPPSQGLRGAGYYDNNNPPNWYKNNPQMMDHQGNKMGPPPGLVVPPPPGAAWGPPQAITSSSEMGSNLSDPPHMLPASPNGGLAVNKSSFSYDELAAATNGFSQANLLGQGGFGYVHKGVLPNGKVVAVKSLKSGSGQGEREFQAEVEIISRVHHRHLVSLVGYCIASGQRMLVYEFVPNKTLEYHLHGKGCPTMEWSKRLKIAMGAAKGLAYLHEDCHPRIIHRDIKTANILIDNNFEAMVADFGLAKLSSDTYTHVSTRIMGTFGYLAPEYASSGKLTEKSDVFSFGVMLLELITGRRPVDTTNTYMEDSLVDWARPILTSPDGDYHELVDPRLEGNFDIGEMACMVACASASIRHSARRRPKMSQIVRALEGDVSLEMLNEGGVKPGQSTAFTSTTSEYDGGSYNASLQKFRKMALATSEEMGSTEYSGLTSTYGLDPSSSSDSSSGEVVNQVPTRRPDY